MLGNSLGCYGAVKVNGSDGQHQLSNSVHDGDVKNGLEFAKKRVGQDGANDRGEVAKSRKDMEKGSRHCLRKIQNIRQVNRQHG